MGELHFKVSRYIPHAAAAEQLGNIPKTDIPKIHPTLFISKESMLTYTSPGNSSFTFYLQPSKPVDAATVNDNAIRVHLKFFNNGNLQSEQTLSGTFARKSFMEWKSNQTPYAGYCTSSSTSYCLVDVTLRDTIMSQDGEQLDGDRNGQPGGDYQHQFRRGMQP